MNTRKRFAWIADRSTRIVGAVSEGLRGIAVGQIHQGVAQAMKACGVPGDARTVRLRLAGEIFKREIRSFNELSDGEIAALLHWAKSDMFQAELTEYIQDRYGKQLPLVPEPRKRSKRQRRRDGKPTEDPQQ